MQKKEKKSDLIKRYLISILLCAVCLIGCDEKSSSNRTRQLETKGVPDSVFVEQILAFDTIKYDQRAEIIKREVNRLKNVEGIERNPFYLYYVSFLEAKDGDEKKADSLVDQMVTEGRSEAHVYKTYLLYDRALTAGTVSATTINELTAELNNAETKKSRFAYLFNDLLAKAYYQNKMIDKSAFYTEKYFADAPYRDHPKVKQRYHDIAFLLAAQKGDFEKMQSSNFEARRLALLLNDSVNYERTIDNETQIYAKMGDNKKALEKSREYVKALRKRGVEREIPYNNLGKTFLLNQQPDSALFFFRKANAIMYKSPRISHVNRYWDGVKDSYVMKGDWKNAFIALDSSRHIEHQVKLLADAKEIEKIHKKYESEKKDANIQALKNANLKKEKTIAQQKWILFSLFLASLGVVGFLYSRYRNRLLREKNALLKEENQRLSTERKMLQVQLNPHFVFNAIANLQGLISTGEKSLASKYLSGFSKILRDTLEQSRKDFITVEEEVNTLKNYLELQKMRFPDLFEYEIITDTVDIENTLIPPMIIQPFIENSIEHGFRNIPYKGLITIHFVSTDRQLKINIEDNGKGITEKTGLQNEKKSLSRVILKERLDALFGNYEIPGSFVTVDKTSDGERGVHVNIELPKITQ